jgi:hypothetical protein
MITSSALAPQGELTGVSVTGTSELSVAGLLIFFRGRLTGAGFTATDDSLLPRGATGAAYARADGTQMIIVAIVDRGPQRSFSLGGTVAA